MSVEAVQRALYGKLAADTTLNALLHSPPQGYAKSIYDREAPEAALFPYVIIDKQSGTPTDTMGKAGAIERDVWQVKGVDRNPADSTPVLRISDRIKDLLNDAELSIQGADHLLLRRLRDIDYPDETVQGTIYRHCGALFRLIHAPS